MLCERILLDQIQNLRLGNPGVGRQVEKGHMSHRQAEQPQAARAVNQVGMCLREFPQVAGEAGNGFDYDEGFHQLRLFGYEWDGFLKG